MYDYHSVSYARAVSQRMSAMSWDCVYDTTVDNEH